jgi:hypothetical protein
MNDLPLPQFLAAGFAPAVRFLNLPALTLTAVSN